MRENEMYLNAWLDYNPALKTSLHLEGNILILNDKDENRKVDISRFYLPNMLYNENFRNEIKIDGEFSAKELFEIIECYVKLNTILENEQNTPYIINVEVRKKDDVEFIVLEDNSNRKYRFDTNAPEKAINIFNELKAKKGYVTLKEFGGALKNDNK